MNMELTPKYLGKPKNINEIDLSCAEALNAVKNQVIDELDSKFVRASFPEMHTDYIGKTVYPMQLNILNEILLITRIIASERHFNVFVDTKNKDENVIAEYIRKPNVICYNLKYFDSFVNLQGPVTYCDGVYWAGQKQTNKYSKILEYREDDVKLGKLRDAKMVAKCLALACHELEHVLQYDRVLNPRSKKQPQCIDPGSIETGMEFDIRHLAEGEKFYQENHDEFATEIEADCLGWVDAGRYIVEYLPNVPKEIIGDVVKYCNNRALSYITPLKDHDWVVNKIESMRNNKGEENETDERRY